MNTQWYNFPNSLGYLTIVTGRLFMSTLSRQLTRRGLDLTAEQWGVLRLLLNEDGQTQEALLRATRYEKSTLSRLLDGMEKKGLVERRRGVKDARRKTVFLKPLGAEQGEAVTAIALRSLEFLYADIPPQDLDTCRDIIQLMQERLLRIGREEEAPQ